MIEDLMKLLFPEDRLRKIVSEIGEDAVKGTTVLRIVYDEADELPKVERIDETDWWYFTGPKDKQKD